VNGVTPEWWQTLIGVLLPLVTALATARGASPAVKAGLLAVLATLTGAASGIATGAAPSELFSEVVMVFVVAVATHYGFWKPTTVTGSAGAIQRSVPGGLGYGGTGRHGRQAEAG